MDCPNHLLVCCFFEQEIIKFIQKIRCSYVKINQCKNIKKIYDAMINNICIEINYDSDDDELLYYLGLYNHIIKNYDKAIKLFKASINKGNEWAMYNLAVIYDNGDGVIKNQDEAKRLYKASIKKDNSHAMNNLAYLYSCSEYKNYDEVIRLYMTAIEKGNNAAMNNLAGLYKDGIFIDKNINMAMKLYKQSIKKNNVHAMKNLANMYKNGKDIDENLNKAAKYYMKYCERTNYSLNRYIDLKEKDIVWKKYLHKWWPNKKFIDQQIITLLLISKNRSKNGESKWIVKGITEIIIGHLATFDKNMKFSD